MGWELYVGYEGWVGGVFSEGIVGVGSWVVGVQGHIRRRTARQGIRLFMI